MDALVNRMPYMPKTDGQRRLFRRWGTPKQFARGVVSASLGVLSVEEAKSMILKYRDEWNSALH